MRQEECVAMIKRSFMVNIDWKSLPKLGTAQYTFLSNGVQTHIVYAHTHFQERNANARALNDTQPSRHNETYHFVARVPKTLFCLPTTAERTLIDSIRTYSLTVY